MEIEDLRRDIAESLDCPPADVRDDDDLLRLGLDSIAVMRLASRWHAQGANVTFAELIEFRTLAQWWEFAQTRMGDSPKTTPAITVDESAAFPLATMQHAYWIGRADGQPLGGVGAHFYNEFDGENVDPARLETAVRCVLARHPMLRAVFHPDGTQQIRPHSAWPGLTVHDLRYLDAAFAQQRLEQLRDEISHRRLNVEKGQTFDIQLSLLPEGKTRMHVQIEMLVADAHSFRVLMSDLAAYYDNWGVGLVPIEWNFPSYLATVAAQPDRNRSVARDYWQQRLDTFPGAPQLPLAQDPSQVSQHRTTRYFHWLDPQQQALLNTRARQHDITLSVAFLTAFTHVLGAWSTTTDFMINLPLYDRRPVHPEVDKLVGDFTNLLLLEVHTGPQAFAALAKATQDRMRTDAANAAYSGVDVLRDLSRRRGGQAVGAPVVFTSALSLGELFDAEVRRCFGAPGYTMSQTPQVWLDYQVTEREGGLYLNWDVVEELFPQGMCEQMFGAYRRIISWLLAQENWDQPLPDMLSSAVHATRSRANDTAAPRNIRLLHHDFFERARMRPERTAVLWDKDGSWTYGELAGRAQALADDLIARGMKPGDAVAVTVPKGPGQVLAVLGVLRAGGTYVPIGIDQPAARRERITARANAAFTITEADLPAVAVPLRDEPLPGDPNAPAYLLFTSGSTGEPKGVMVPHTAALNTLDDLIERFHIGPSDRVLGVSALDFDLSVFDIFAMLSAGGALVTVSEETRRDPEAWVDLVLRHDITIWQSVPAVLDLVLTAAGERVLPLRLALLGGDWVALNLAPRFPGQLVALGGTTETAIHSTVQLVPVPLPEHWRSVPYGVPLHNQLMRVVDAHGRDCPDWVAGELWIGGHSVALGYTGDPDRTAAQFVTHQGQRWYRTGDEARYWPDGTVEFLGRRDFQLKIRGHRIEPGEIEVALESDPLVKRAVVLAIGEGGNRQLAAAVTGSPDPAALRDLLVDRVPAYMIPGVIAVLDEFPLSANGKIDRRRLEQLITVDSGGDMQEPEGETEQTVAALWSELLGVAQIGRQHNFFALGGDSLIATKLLARLRILGLGGVQLRHLFSSPTLREFAAHLTPEAAPAPLKPIEHDPEHRNDPFPPTDVQRAYWLGRSDDFALGGVGSHWYWEFEGSDVDVARLEEAVNRLVQRHEMLRAIFDDDGNQRILAEVPRFTIGIRDDAEAMRAELSQRIPDPARWPLIEIQSAGNRLGFSFDYIVLDALSIVIFFSELSTLYSDLDAALPELGVSFRDYVRREAEGHEDAAAYWLKRLDSLTPAAPLPLAKDPATLTKPVFHRREDFLNPAQWKAIVETARAHQVTPASVLAAAYAEVLSAFSGADQHTLNATMFHRDDVHPDINNILGDFTSLLLVGHHAEPGDSWLDTVQRLQKDMWDGMQNGAVSALWVLRELARRQQGDAVSMPIVFTSALGVAPDLVNMRFPFGSLSWGISQTPQVWLDNQVMEREGGLAFNWDSVDELFPENLLDTMFAAYRNLLVWLAEGNWNSPVPDMLPASQRAIRAQVNNTSGERPWRTLHEPFFTAGPAGVAVIHRDVSLTYGELRAKALTIAGTLVSKGVKPGDTVAVTLPRGPGQIAAVLGVLAAGAAYVPVGVEQPLARRERIYAKAGVKAIINTELSFDDGPALTEPVYADPNALAYIIFTSGSTGEPKGVEITHAAAVNTIDDINTRHHVGPQDRVLAISALDFDLSVYDIFGLLSAGGALVLIDDEDRREARLWAQLVPQHGITVWNSVPALLDMLLTVSQPQALASLRTVLVSGDWVGLDLPGRLKNASPSATFVAMGGATEAAIWSNAIEVTEVPPHWKSIPYGTPLRNQAYRVTDHRGRDCPDWVPGELRIGGAGVALGYRGEPGLTAAQFVTGEDGQRWYRTGDQGRYWPDGTLEFLGRLDFQVKIRGHRIELGEIEAVAAEHPGVSRAVAVVAGPGIALGVFAPFSEVDLDALARTLAERLPSYMVPDQIQLLEQIPLSANGKVDRTAVRQLFGNTIAEAASEQPAGEAEKLLAELWAQLLGDGTPIGRHRSFFALGGDSLLATRLLELMRQRFGVVLTLRQLFAAPTIAQLAAFVDVQPGDFEEGVI
ncbi:non-ribosomal peptide synthetase [Catelliglobosispora koreensis]|uniref:non-ribosomal peptide synthetase n=1 Tax=Catelliglobosispora koreensis TaxID=129052 RepID=UPI0003672AE4|nr:non-ribosomal peptide synthetase [Catelliglobosispora koreensis]